MPDPHGHRDAMIAFILDESDLGADFNITEDEARFAAEMIPDELLAVESDEASAFLFVALGHSIYFNRKCGPAAWGATVQ